MLVANAKVNPENNTTNNDNNNNSIMDIEKADHLSDRLRQFAEAIDNSNSEDKEKLSEQFREYARKIDENEEYTKMADAALHAMQHLYEDYETALRGGKTKEEFDEYQRCNKVRYGRYIMAWKKYPIRMWVILLIELFVGFLAILSATGSFQQLSSFVSFMYLIYIFVSSKTDNFNKYVRIILFCGRSIGMQCSLRSICSCITCCCTNLRCSSNNNNSNNNNNANNTSWCKDKWYEELLMYFAAFLLTIYMLVVQGPISIIQDLVEVSDTYEPQILSFVAADMVVIIASVNYAARALTLLEAIPLLVSFDFLTDLAPNVADSILISDEDAVNIYEKNIWEFNFLIFSPAGFLIFLTVGIIIAALVLAYLSIGLSSFT